MFERCFTVMSANRKHFQNNELHLDQHLLKTMLNGFSPHQKFYKFNNYEKLIKIQSSTEKVHESLVYADQETNC